MAKKRLRQRLQQPLQFLADGSGAEPSLPISQLETRSGCSRRALQRAFQQRFGCAPMQWLRRQADQGRRQGDDQPRG